MEACPAVCRFVWISINISSSPAAGHHATSVLVWKNRSCYWVGISHWWLFFFLFIKEINTSGLFLLVELAPKTKGLLLEIPIIFIRVLKSNSPPNLTSWSYNIDKIYSFMENPSIYSVYFKIVTSWHDIRFEDCTRKLDLEEWNSTEF